MKLASFVYLLRCRDDTLYAGWSTDPFQREKAHNSGRGAKYTRSRLPVQLVYIERCTDKSEALTREYQLKQLTREQKERLIASEQNELRKGESDMTKFPYTGVSHIGINTRNLDAALHFYRDVLGMEISMQIVPPEDLTPDAPLYAFRGRPFMTQLRACNGLVIEIFSPAEGREEITINRNNFGMTHFCLDVTDMAEALRILKEENVTIESEPAPTGGAAWIRDPDGNLIELMPPR